MLFWKEINTSQLMKRDIWDTRIPETTTDVVALLKRRITVHEAWRKFILSDYENAQGAVSSGVGTAESHKTYAAQYTAAIAILERKLI